MRVNLSIKRAGIGMLVAAVSGLILTLAPIGTASADDLPVTHVSGTLSSNQTWSSDHVYVVDSELTIPSGTTLTISAGAIVKVPRGYWNSGISVASGGALQVNGTSSAPVSFTSLADDSLGGDSGGDGATAGAINDYNTAVDTQNGGTVNIAHAAFKYARYGYGGGCTGGSTLATTIRDSTFESPLWLNCASGTIDLERNQFNVGQGYPMTIYNADLSGINLSGANQNTFTGSGQMATLYLYAGSVPSDSAWSVSGSTGGTLATYALNVNGILNVGAGTIVKAMGPSGSPTINVGSTGALNVSGTSGSPATITSIQDDSIGGDSGGDGATSGSAQNYLNAVSLSGGAQASIQQLNVYYADSAFWITTGAEADLGGVNIAHVSKGVYVDGGAKVTFRGSITDASSKAIQACNWDQSCSVDAAYTDWGSAAGPQSNVCGRVTTMPWTHGGTNYNGPLFIPNCDNAPTPQANLTSSISAFQGRVNQHQIDCSNGYQDACQAIGQAYACLSGALDVAESTSPWPLPPAGNADEVNAFGGQVVSGANDYVTAHESLTPGQFSFAIAAELDSVVNTFIVMSNAYDSCG